MSVIKSLLNWEGFGVHRGKLNDNFAALNADKVEASNVLVLNRTLTYTPTGPYHPATKEYADELRTSWDTVFNPRSLTGDIFDRANHTGMQPADTITQDSSYRFVTDLEKALWNSKEDSIGTRGTAFNKDFGTTPGTVAEGDHLHSKDEMGLDQVDNTSDLAKPISTATQDALDLKAGVSDVDAGLAAKLDSDLADFAPMAGVVDHQEGRVFYDHDTHSLSVQSDIQGSTLNLGQEAYIRVINATGSPILNGSACRHNGVIGGRPSIALAQADTFSHSIVLGIATHDIADGAEGFLTTHGSVGDLATGGHPEGQPLYLSDTIAGAYTATPPQIVTQIGGVLVADATDGFLFVSIINNLVLPTVIGFMHLGLVPTTIDGTFRPIVSYADEHSHLLPVDAAAGTITVVDTGIYRVTATVNIRHDDTGNDTGIAILSLFDGTINVLEMQFNVSKNQIGTNLSMNIPFLGDAAISYSLRISSTIDLTNVTDAASSFDIKSEHID